MATTVESLRKAIGKRKNSRAFAWLADLMRQNGDLDLALECVRAGLSSTPCEEGNLVLSRILADKRDWDGVVEACEFVLLRNPYCLSAIRRIGDAYAEKGDVEKRNSYYRRLHDLDPLDAFWKEEYAPKIEIPESGDAETPVEAPAETVEPAEVPAAERAENPEPLVEESRNAAEEKDDDPFSSLSTLLPADEENDNEVSFNDLEHSLDDAIAGFGEAKPEKDAFPAEEIDGDDISTALSGIFGSTDAEDSFASTVKPEAEKDAPRPDAEDKPQSLSDAFDSIFGEDELPEEFVLSKPAVPSTDKPSTTAASDASSESSAKLPSEKVSNDLPPAEETSPFEKSASQTQPTSESTLEKSVESSFDSLFGENSDDLPLETLTSPKTILPAEPDASSESSVELPSEKSLNALPSEEESSTFEKSAPQTKSASESTLEKSVESSFDSLFGADSDDLPLETLTSPKTILPAASDASSESSAELPSEKVSNDLPAAEESSPFEKSALQAQPTSESALEKSVESSFDSLFGENSDDALVEDPTTSTRTLAEIYFEQGVYDEAIKIYKDLLRKSPEDESLKKRLSEIENVNENRQKDN